MKSSLPSEIPSLASASDSIATKALTKCCQPYWQDVGDKPFPISEVAANSESWDEFKREIDST